MLAYIARRIGWGMSVIFAVSICVFIGIHLAPGDPARVLLGSYATNSTLQSTKQAMGLNRPLYVQYAVWLWSMLQGNFGTSLIYHQTVSSLLSERLGATAVLGLGSLVIAVPCGIALGIVGAIQSGKWSDTVISIFSFMGLSMPGFWVGVMGILLFSVTLQWLPASGMYSPSGTNSFPDLLRHLVIPATTLSIVPLSVIARITRAAMLEILNQDYIRTARAKGCSLVRTTTRHALRSALPPIIIIIGNEITYVLGGVVVVESVFAWPGVGRLLLSAILNRDYPVVMGGTIMVAVVLVATNLLIDVLSAMTDPKVKLH